MVKRIGEEFDIKVSIEDAYQVIGLNAWISYDPTIVEPVDMDSNTEGTQINATDLGFFSNAQLLVGVQKNQDGVEQPGTLICGYSSSPATPTDGTADAFLVKFRAIAAGVSDINFVVGHINLQDEDGDIPTDWYGDSVDVPVTATVRLTVL